MKEYYIIDRKTGKYMDMGVTTIQQACKNFIYKIKEHGVDSDLVLCENVLGI